MKAQVTQNAAGPGASPHALCHFPRASIFAADMKQRPGPFQMSLLHYQHSVPAGGGGGLAGHLALSWIKTTENSEIQ
jgi:hypothetical protein